MSRKTTWSDLSCFSESSHSAGCAIEVVWLKRKWEEGSRGVIQACHVVAESGPLALGSMCFLLCERVSGVLFAVEVEENDDFACDELLKGAKRGPCCTLGSLAELRQVAMALAGGWAAAATEKGRAVVTVPMGGQHVLPAIRIDE